MIRINVREITGLDTLAGKVGGLRDFPKFVAALEETPSGSTVFLDWSGVEISTASYLGTTFVPLLRMAMAGELDRYFVVCGMNKTCLDEFKLVLELQGLVALVGNLGRDGLVHNVQVLGTLDLAYTKTLDAVQHVNLATASQLHKRDAQTHTRIGKTAWINRLSKLHRLRLVRKQRIGREYVFQTVSEEN